MPNFGRTFKARARPKTDWFASFTSTAKSPVPDKQRVHAGLFSDPLAGMARTLIDWTM